MRRKRIKYAQLCSIFISIIEFEKTRGLCIVTTQIEKLRTLKKEFIESASFFQSALPQCMSYLLYTCLNAGRERQSAWWTVITELIKLSPFNP